MLQEAIAKKVDHDPAVRSQLEAAQREILVRNHLQNVLAGVASPSDEAVSKFYADHPDLFKDRLIYQVSELVLPRIPPNWSEIEKVLFAAKNMPRVLETVSKRGINFPVTQNIVRGAEDLPLEKLKEIAKLKDGELIIYSRPTAIVITQIVGRRAASLDEANAKPMITSILPIRRRRRGFKLKSSA